MIKTRNVLLLTAAALALGWFSGEGTTPAQSLVQARRDIWQLQPLPMPDDAAARAVVVATAPQWGVDKAALAAAQAPVEQPRWRVAGVYGNGRKAGVLILYEGDRKPPERLKVGEKLPDGQVIEWVDGNLVWARLGKKRESFGVENRE